MAERRFKGPGEWHRLAVQAREEALRRLPPGYPEPSMPDWTPPETPETPKLDKP
jgi:hypothetical protein